MTSKRKRENTGYSSIHTDGIMAESQDEDKPPDFEQGRTHERIATVQHYTSSVESGATPRAFTNNGAEESVGSLYANKGQVKVHASPQYLCDQDGLTNIQYCTFTLSDKLHLIDYSTFLHTALENETGLVLEGEMGSGKTSIVRDIIYQYKRYKALQKYTRVMAFNIADIWEAENMEEFTKCLALKEALDEHSTGSLWLMVFELPAGCGFTDKISSNSIVMAILQRKLFPEATILVTCRPSQVQSLKSVFKVHTHYRLTHSERYLKGHSASKIFERYHLESLCTSPLICDILVRKIRMFESAGTFTEAVRMLVSELVHYDLDEDEIAALGLNDLLLERLPESAEAVFDVQCLLAMKHMLRGHACKSLAESRQFLSSFGLKQPKVSLKECFRFGLLEMTTDEKATCAYQFLDPVIMQFLAAFHLYKQAPLNQLHFLFENTRILFDNGFKLWLRFFFGLVGGDYTSHITMHNPSKLMLNSVVEVLVYNLMADHDPEYRTELIKDIHEAQEKSLFKKLAQKHQPVLDLSVTVEEFDDCVDALGSLAIKSTCSTWVAITDRQNESRISSLKLKAQNVKIEVNYRPGLVDRIDFSPKRAATERDRVERDAERSARAERTTEAMMEKFNQFGCRAVREILQRVLPMYSEVKLKGDSTNTSYVSFLTCGCFEESFLKHVKLFPLVAVHFLDGEKKVSPTTPPETLTVTDRHNLAKHSGNSQEVVIMLRPLVQRLECTVPGTDEQFSLVFSKDLELVHSSSTPVSGDAMYRCVDCTEQDYEMTGDHTQQIVPPLPVVQKTLTARSQTAYPKAFVPPASGPPRVDPILPTVHEEREESHDDTRISPDVEVTAFPDQQVHSSNQYLQLHRPLTQTALTGGASSIQPLQGGLLPLAAFEEQAVGEMQTSSRRQGAMRAGTVLFTSMPDKIPSDRILPIPTQRTLIRKGGNGSIYSENVAGMTMAVKKTSYRSKEYAIVTKVRHKNLVPLFAYTWGEEHERSKRRYYVYHYLPKLSGDLARLVTDHEELSLAQYRVVNQYNPRALGLAVGNVKYILSQILQGMHYLHEMGIAHRDLKASNILVKFFCNCDTPLSCGCGVKYQIVICDFDAAIELDPQGRIPPTQAPPSPTRGYTPPHYEVVPVGTNGFRSPESSMLTIANHPDAFSPPVTTKTDLYSFGVLSLRLMISTDMAYSQRSIATLLLHYHQIKGLCEGRINRQTTTHLVRVDKQAVEKIVRLHKLRPKMAWLRGAYDFVAQCLSVDPEARPSAGDLLRDPFLN